MDSQRRCYHSENHSFEVTVADCERRVYVEGRVPSFVLSLHCGSVYCSLYGLFLLLAGMPHRDTTSASRGAYLLAGPKPPGRDSCSYGSRWPHLLSVLGTEATLNTCAVCFGGERPPGAVSLHDVNVLSRWLQALSACGLLKFYVLYHVAAVTVPLAVLFAGGFLFHSNLALFNQLAEFYATPYNSCSYRLAEYHAKLVKRRGDKFEAIFGLIQPLYVFGETA